VSDSSSRLSKRLSSTFPSLSFSSSRFPADEIFPFSHSVQLLEGALGSAKVGDCSYIFGLSSPKAVVATARLLENVGKLLFFSESSSNFR